jgi:2-keto-3-deoxy-L-rhamnonate aldolase RhmA
MLPTLPLPLRRRSPVIDRPTHRKHGPSGRRNYLEIVARPRTWARGARTVDEAADNRVAVVELRDKQVAVVN